MSGNDSSATATLTPTSVAVVPAVINAAEEEEEDPATLTLDCVESTADVDLVNGPNPWLPAYGFQLQHHSQFQPTHLEDLRANGSYMVNVPTCFPFFFYTCVHSLSMLNIWRTLALSALTCTMLFPQLSDISIIAVSAFTWKEWFC